MKYIVIALVFSAVALIGYLALVLVYRIMHERQEHGKQKIAENIKRIIDPVKLLRIRLAVALILGCGLFSLLLCLGNRHLFMPVFVSTLLGILGFWLPYGYYRWKAVQRQVVFESKLLDFAMNLANGMRSGMALMQSFEKTAKRMTGPMKEELMTVVSECRLNTPLSEALDRLNQRMPCEDLQLLVTTIRFVSEKGGSIVDVLDKMIVMIRQRKEFQERLKNMTAQGRFQAIAISAAPVVSFFLLYFIDRDLMSPLITTSVGWCIIGVIAVLISTGFFVINKIVTIEV